MGACLSCGSSSKLKCVRVVHLSGYVEDFEAPISANQVTGYPPKHLVCTSLQLLSCVSKPLMGDTQLQPGHVYFLLPYSIFQADVSPVDLASLAKRLTAIAKTSRGASSTQQGMSPVWASPSPSTSPARFGVPEQNSTIITYGGRNSYRAQPWKPILDTIREKSFTRRSESDLQERD